ncbi:MAG: hypothetical protein JWR17_1387 [Pseudomonas sp.]|jgi:hypothetical protein|uniref:hypothetical protein n=1 Tax=Pseudomonas sp. TaxID=306 RepID=UPI00260BB1CA|nr:hypothetical protein [Pseudomonas sp.]MDB6048641.1 hypothetical protein [Pseudomonas sp.]
MNCLICNTEAQRIKTMGDWVEQDCPACGRFRVSGALFADMKTNRQAFNVEKARSWLDKQRAENRAENQDDHSPLIDSPDSGLVLD